MELRHDNGKKGFMIFCWLPINYTALLRRIDKLAKHGQSSGNNFNLSRPVSPNDYYLLKNFFWLWSRPKIDYISRKVFALFSKFSKFQILLKHILFFNRNYNNFPPSTSLCKRAFDILIFKKNDFPPKYFQNDKTLSLITFYLYP